MTQHYVHGVYLHKVSRLQHTGATVTVRIRTPPIRICHASDTVIFTAPVETITLLEGDAIAAA